MDYEIRLVLLTYHKIIHSSLQLKIGVLLEFQKIKKKKCIEIYAWEHHEGGAMTFSIAGHVWATKGVCLLCCHGEQWIKKITRLHLR